MRGKTLARDGAFLLGAESLSRLVAFSLSFVVARTIGLEDLASLTLALSLIAFATVAGDSGLGTVAVADISRGGSVTVSVRRTAPLQIWTSVVASLAVSVYIATTMGFPMAVAVAGLPVVVACATGYVLQAQFRHRELAVSRTLGNLVTGVFGSAVALAGQPLHFVALAYVAGALVTTVSVLRLAGTSTRDLLRVPDFAHIRVTWATNVGVLMYMLTLHTYSTAQLWLSERLAASTHFVETAIAVRLLTLAVIPGVMLGSLLLPRYASRPPTIRQRSGHACIAGGAGLVGALLGSGFAPLYVPVLFGAEADQAVEAVQVVMLHLPASFAATVLTAALLSQKTYLKLVVTYGLALVVQVCWCLWHADATTEWFVAGIVVSEWLFVLMLLLVTVWARDRRAVARA